jgi:hypothetical protein
MDEAELARRRDDARAAVIAAWKATGWPNPPATISGYERLTDCMATYLDVVFPQLGPARQDEVVCRTLRGFMAPLHLRPHRSAPPQPEELVAALEDTVLDAHTDLRSVGFNDDQTAYLGAGAGPDDVREALMGLVADRLALEFRIITQYLDLIDRDSARPPSSTMVAAALGLSGDDAVRTVKPVLLDFRRRVKLLLAEATTADDHA